MDGVSEFSEMYGEVRELLLDMHSVTVQFCYDESVAEPVWYSMRVTLERNSSEADRYRKSEGSQLTRQYCSFLFEKGDFARDNSGYTRLPGTNSVVLHDGHKYRASQGDSTTVWSPEDHEGQVIRLRTTEQEADV